LAGNTHLREQPLKDSYMGRITSKRTLKLDLFGKFQKKRNKCRKIFLKVNTGIRFFSRTQKAKYLKENTVAKY
jgi:hypothetical protein